MRNRRSGNQEAQCARFELLNSVFLRYIRGSSLAYLVYLHLEITISKSSVIESVVPLAGVRLCLCEHESVSVGVYLLAFFRFLCGHYSF